MPPIHASPHEDRRIPHPGLVKHRKATFEAEAMSPVVLSARTAGSSGPGCEGHTD